MAINRKALVQSHNPHFTACDLESPLTVGNGEFAFTADITGLQTFYQEYKKILPLCTQSQWGWHSTPVSEKKARYFRSDLAMTSFDTYGRSVGYAKDRIPGNEEVYDWLRENPHRLNLGRIGLSLTHKNGEPVRLEELSNVDQTLDLYSGILTSRFQTDGSFCQVKTCVHPYKDALLVEISSPMLADGRAKVEIRFPYGSPDISASDWEREDRHQTEVLSQLSSSQGEELCLKRTLDQDSYYVAAACQNGSIQMTEKHCAEIKGTGETLLFSVLFSRQEENPEREFAFSLCREHWKTYWEKGGILSLKGSTHPKAEELERRIILSQYLTAIQCAGSVPPQETGLTCNSWYGKFHLEMHFWHSAHFHFWNRTALLERSMEWYGKHLPDAKALAAEQGYKGARWPKMLAEDGVDTPSVIAPLLIWQQPHILVYLEYCYQDHPNQETLFQYREIVEETAAFLADYAVYDEERDRYVLGPPVIPAQECHAPENTINPTYELEYWRSGLKIACAWRRRMGEKPDPKWLDILEKMALPAVRENTYLAHEHCPETFEKAAVDHPSMLCAYGLLDGERIDPQIMAHTLDRVLQEWDFPSMWGWDFGVIAMTATLLGRPQVAVDALLLETEKNTYVASGNNLQRSRSDLPLYLPGNGSLLLAVAMMAAGWKGSTGKAPGFPDNGQWRVEFEGLRPMWYGEETCSETIKRGEIKNALSHDAL